MATGPATPATPPPTATQTATASTSGPTTAPTPATPSQTDTDGDGVADPTDNCLTTAEDPDGNQDTDGCPENASHNIGVDTFRTWARVNLARCGSPCTNPITIRITNFGTHRETDVAYAIATAGGPARTNSSACSGNAALRSRDGDVDPGETVVVRGCTRHLQHGRLLLT